MPIKIFRRNKFAVCGLVIGVCFFVGWMAAAQSVSNTQEPMALRGPSFVPDTKVDGASLSGWQKLGSAEWKTENGELVGKGTAGDGWLVLNHSLQDVGAYAAFRCSGTCETGILVRMAKAANGWTGTYLSIKGGDLDAYSLTLDDHGGIVAREKLRDARGQFRFAPSQDEPTTLPQVLNDPTVNQVSPDQVPIKRIRSSVRVGQWNELELLLDENVMRGYLNDTGQEVSVATENLDIESFGEIALYVGKGSEVHFKAVSYKDIAMRVQPEEKVGDRFRVRRITPFYYNWTAAAADFNHDGKIDLISGAYLYYGPDFTKSREIYPARTFNPSTEYSVWIQHAYDFNGDGWPDIVATNLSRGAVVYINPGNSSRRWKQYRVVPTMQAENSLLVDVDSDGKPELVYIANGYMRYAKPDPAHPTESWTVHNVSEKGPWPAHGIGVGDVNGDGRSDIVGADGWWEQPASGAGQGPWKYHPEAFGRWGRIGPGGATIGIYDVNGDGLNDVVTQLEAHGFGLAWFEQKKSSNGEISFVRHMVMDDYNTENAGGVIFSELHGSAVADVDGDGIPDFIVGKRQFSHRDDFLDPDVYGPPYLYWYKTVRDPKAPGGARLEPELIHNDSGAGDNLLPLDLNGDGVMDIVAATKRGLYIFWGQPQSKAAHK
ncbi:MAG: repeat protein [Acidobacteriaceae bacterium]|nr:repeat protein [Acidobacteriaceae bacterium]